MSATDIMAAVSRGAAVLRAAQYKRPILIKMHPDDIRMLADEYLGISTVNEDMLAAPWELIGIPLFADESVPAGEPRAEYHQPPS